MLSGIIFHQLVLFCKSSYFKPLVIRCHFYGVKPGKCLAVRAATNVCVVSTGNVSNAGQSFYINIRLWKKEEEEEKKKHEKKQWRILTLNHTVEISPANHMHTSCPRHRSIVYLGITTAYGLMPSSVNPLVLTEIINVWKRRKKHSHKKRLTDQREDKINERELLLVWRELFALTS